jgi:aminobenzoyl-glutamate transport protein
MSGLRPGSGGRRHRALDAIERLGNALPDPALLFVWLSLALVAASVLAAAAGVSALHPLDGARIEAQSLLSKENLRRLLVEMPQTFTAFPPLGLVIVVMLGAAVAERSGLFAAAIGRSVRHLPDRLLTPATFLIALLSHHASDAAYVVLIPLAAMVFHRAGRHPLHGIAVAYAGISGAFAANLLPGQFDVLILGITHSAAKLVDLDHVLNPLGNWWFTATLAVVLFVVAWWVAERLVAPRLASMSYSEPAAATSAGEPAQAGAGPDTAGSRTSTHGLRHAAVAAAVVVAAYAALLLWPGGGPLEDPSATGSARHAPFYRSLVAGFMLLFLACGWAYGRAVGSIRSHRDVVRMMADGLRELTPYFVLAFFAAHFIAMFSWSNLGPILAIHGAGWLRSLELGPVAVLVPLVAVSLLFDLLIGSASAKWSAMAPVVVPMLLLAGISPEMSTAAFRVGDSIVNIITPVAANFVLVLVMCQRWSAGFGIGSLISMMLPFSIAFGIAGLALVCVWAGFDLPLGPGAPASLPLPPGR